MNNYIINCDNHLFCGMGTQYVAIANDEKDFEYLLDHLAYENFMDLGGWEDYEENEYTANELDQAPYWTVELFNEETDGEFDWYELIYDGSDK